MQRFREKNDRFVNFLGDFLQQLLDLRIQSGYLSMPNRQEQRGYKQKGSIFLVFQNEEDFFCLKTSAMQNNKHNSWKKKWYDIIFEADSRAGKQFDVCLLVAIFLSVLVVMADSVEEIHQKLSIQLDWIEWIFTIIFTLEYFVRIIISPNKKNYLTSTWGIIDLLSSIPTYLSLFVHGPQFLLVVRIFRLLRIFRILRLTSFQKEAKKLAEALKASGAKIIVFFVTIISMAIMIGTIMYIIEDNSPGFQSIPQAIYWAIVTITTVGYGDITPQTPLGQFFSAFLMIVGYAVIAVPTGIVSVEFSKKEEHKLSCTYCHYANNPSKAKFCTNCGKLIGGDV